MKALSIKQPWASLIMAGRKEIEVRTWKTDYRGPLIIHAGKKIDREAMDFFRGLNPVFDNRLGPPCKIIRNLEFPMGCILGKVNLMEICLMLPNAWRRWRPLHCIPDPYHTLYHAWWISNPIKLKNPIPCKGQLGLFNIDDSLLPW